MKTTLPIEMETTLARAAFRAAGDTRAVRTLFCRRLAALISLCGLILGEIPSLRAAPATLTQQSLELAEDDPWDFDIQGGMGGASTVRINDLRPGKLRTTDFIFKTGVTLPVAKDWSTRYGLLFRSKQFSSEGRIPFVKNAHVLALDFRATGQLGSSLLLVAGALPGSYGQKYSSESFDVPGYAMLAYNLTKSLTFVAGARYDDKSNHVFLPIGGLRWAPTPDFRVNLLAPRSTIEYDWTETTMLFLTGNYVESAFHINDARLRNIDEKLDKVRGRLRDLFPNANLPPILADDDFDFPTLVNTELRYREIQAGLGISWRLDDFWRFDVEGGWSVVRDLSFHDAGVEVETAGQPYYVRLGFRGRF